MIKRVVITNGMCPITKASVIIGYRSLSTTYTPLFIHQQQRHFSNNPPAQVKLHRHHQQQPQSRERKSYLLPQDGLTLGDFVQKATAVTNSNTSTTSSLKSQQQQLQSQQLYTFHIKTYGCQMNVNDTDIVRAVLLENGYQEFVMNSEKEDVDHNGDTSFSEVIIQRNNNKHSTTTASTTTTVVPDIILTNTCAIREKAEEKVWQRLKYLRKYKSKNQIIGVLGCMAERLQQRLLDNNIADIVIGPDQYRQIPNLIQPIIQNRNEQQLTAHEQPQRRSLQAMNVELSLTETYDDIIPVRDEVSNPYSAFVSIQRGCSNRCSFCIVPFTRGGKERSRSYQSIIDEVTYLVQEQNIKEVVLLGQNVNSYHDRSQQALQERPETNILSLSNDGFKSRWKRPNTTGGYRFIDLVESISDISPELRVRFTSPHPKDYPKELLYLMAERSNVCSQLHMPAQSGSTTMLKRMKRGYSREAYIELIDTVKDIIPDVAMSSDFIAGFCDETEEEHNDTVSLLEYVEYEQAYLFAYSMRDKTHASKTMHDNIPATIKQRRLQELIDVFREKVHAKNERLEIGKLRLVLVEGPTKNQNKLVEPGTVSWHGRTDQNKRILFSVPIMEDDDETGLLRASTFNEQYVKKTLNEQDFHNHSHHCQGQQGRHWNWTLPNNKGSLRRLDFSDIATTTDLVPGDYAVVYVTEAKGHTLRGRMLWKTSLANFATLESSHLRHLSPADVTFLEEKLALSLKLVSEPEVASMAVAQGS